MIEIMSDETLDDLNKVNRKIIQKKNGFRFSVDAVLIANFTEVKHKNSVVMDIGTGSGIIPLLLSQNENIKKIYGVEIIEENASLAKRSIELNGLENKIEIINSDIKELKVDYKVDIIVTNPPYIKSENGKISENGIRAVSKHEIKLTIRELIENSKRILKSGGSFNIICRTNRFQENIAIFSENNFFVKRIKPVHVKPGKSAMLYMIEAVKDKSYTPDILEPIYIYDSQGNYTEEIKNYY